MQSLEGLGVQGPDVFQVGGRRRAGVEDEEILLSGFVRVGMAGLDYLC